MPLLTIAIPAPSNFILSNQGHMGRKKIVDVIALLFILLFVYAATSKLLDYEKFVVQVGQSPMLTSMAAWIAALVPLVELVIAGLLVFERTRLAGLYGSFCLMIVFTGYIILASRFSDYTPCSCGGVLEGMSWDAHLAFNVFFVGVAIVGVLVEVGMGEIVDKG